MVVCAAARPIRGAGNEEIACAREPQAAHGAYGNNTHASEDRVSLILCWALYPLVLAALGVGWGTLVERAAGKRVNDALLIPLGLAATLVVAGTITTWPAIAPADVTIVALGAIVGIALALRARRSIARLPLLVAVAVLLLYGAPILLSGQATFAGVVKLDDTATWLNIIDNVVSHGRSTAQLPISTYRLNFEQANPSYPLGSFLLPGVARGLTGLDMAWLFQPYLASCAAALALCLYALVEPLIASARLRALLIVIAAQPALLYAYSLWSGIKEMTAAFLLALGVALAAPLMRSGPGAPRDWRALLPLALATGALMQTLSIGAGGWMAPAIVLIACAWLLPARIVRGVREAGSPLAQRARAAAAAFGALIAATAACMVPVWSVLGAFLSNSATLFSEGQSAHTRLGNLFAPLKAAQLAGIWPEGDFRDVAPLFPTALFVALVILCALGALAWSVRRRQFGIALYLFTALGGCVIFDLGGATPWVTAKALAISSPALLTAALVALGALIERRRGSLAPIAGGAPAAGSPSAPSAPRARQARRGARRAPAFAGALGALGALILAGGVLWSNVLAYGDVTLAARPRMVELEHIGSLVAGKGPTLLNEYEVYADRHFLREGEPTEPAEYRPGVMPTALRNGILLTKAAWANLNAFPLSTLLYYRSIVTRRSPVESRPPSIYKLVWQGRYYQLWQRPQPAPRTILEQIPYGESNSRPYCGNASNGPTEMLCAIHPVAIPSCPQLQEFAKRARAEHAHLVAYTEPEPRAAFGDEMRWPAAWGHELQSHTLFPTTPGTAVSHMYLPASERYEVFIGGSFSRGIEVSVDGHPLGLVKNELAGPNTYAPVGHPIYLQAGVHEIDFTFPAANLAPGSAEDTLTAITGYAFEPVEAPGAGLVSVAPARFRVLCNRYLDWVEIVAGQ
jgi:hypothetical protein